MTKVPWSELSNEELTRQSRLGEDRWAIRRLEVDCHGTTRILYVFPELWRGQRRKHNNMAKVAVRHVLPCLIPIVGMVYIGICPLWRPVELIIGTQCGGTVIASPLKRTKLAYPRERGWEKPGGGGHHGHGNLVEATPSLHPSCCASPYRGKEVTETRSPR